MSNGFVDKMKMKIAAPRKQAMDLSCDLYTTHDFGYNKVSNVTLLVPGDNVNVHVESILRTDPLAFPTLGKVNLVNRHFFVPLRTIMKGFNEFVTGQPFVDNAYNAIISYSPRVTNNWLVTQFTTRGNGLTTEGTSSDNDFAATFAGTSTVSYSKFTYNGRLLYDLLNNLGYSINWNTADTTVMSALPLLAWIRIYLDYLVPSQYCNSQENRVLRKWLTMSPNTILDANYPLSQLIISLKAYLERDVFTMAWDNPLGPNENGLTPSISNPDSDSALVQSSRTNGSYFDMEEVSSSGQYVNSFAVRALLKVQDFLNRNQLSGSNVVDNILARWGVSPSDAKMQRSVFLGKHAEPVKIFDVMSNAATEEADLGDYAGKAFAYSNGDSFAYSSDEFGYLITITTIHPHIGYAQGRKPHVFAFRPLDFYQPEFDSLGTEAIRNDILYADYHNGSDYTNGQTAGGRPDGIFGYAPQYWWYKCALDTLSGDFRTRANKSGVMDNMHLLRLFAPPSSRAILNHNATFLRQGLDGNGTNFDRIFNDTSNDVDHFVLMMQFNITAHRNMLSLTESLPLNGEREVMMHYQGTQV